MCVCVGVSMHILIYVFLNICVYSCTHMYVLYADIFKTLILNHFDCMCF